MSNLTEQDSAILLQELIRIAEEESAERLRPSNIRSVRVYPDGDQWCCLCGEDIQEGVAGFGRTPIEATADFDRNWRMQRLTERCSGVNDE